MGKYDIPTPAVLFDVDGTLADCEHRRHHVTGKHKHFGKFFAEMHLDKKFPVISGLCNMYYMNGWHVIICTARAEMYRQVTEKWLLDNGIFYTELMMRPDERMNDPDTDIKETMLAIIRRQREVHAAYDDRDKVVAMWRRNGVTCLQVAEGDF